jgi:vitamin B12 transporter
MKFLKLVSFSILSYSFLSADNSNLDQLLGEFTQKSDLSEKTKLSNAGHSIIFTRDDIERMQARNLKDILKGLPLITYQENRFGIPNIRNIGSIIPFSSSSVRVYLDDHEMVSGAYGSTFALFGNIELEFVDHIEIYYDTPSFEYSVESTSLLIKLHTKIPQRDKGGKVSLSSGSYGYNQESAFYSDTLNNISYFAYASNLNNNRYEPIISDKEISRDSTRKHFLGTISDKYNHLLIDSQYVDLNPLSNLSVDATSTNSLIEQNNIQISYINTYLDNIKIKTSYQKSYNKINFKDDAILFGYPSYYPVYDFLSEYNDSVFSSEIDYGYKDSLNNFYIGANTRMKIVDLIGLKHDGRSIPINPTYDRQYIYSFFAQDELSISDNSIISAGVKYSNIDNNGGIDDSDFALYRIGYVYNKNNFTSKIFYYHTPNLIEPYLYTSWFSNSTNLKPEISDIIYTQLSYEIDKNYLSLMYGRNNQKNTLYTNGVYLDNSKDIQNTDFVNLDYKYSFNSLNSISTNYFINFNEDTPSFGNYKQYGGYIRFLNTIEKVDIFNEIIYRENSIKKHASFDYSTGIKYKYNHNLSFSVKGENLFNKAYEDEIRSLNYANIVVGEASSIDRRVYVTLEYMF